MKGDYIVIYHITKEKTSKELVQLAVVWNRNVNIAVRGRWQVELILRQLAGTFC